ncbi:hypothetical protein ACG7TL_005272 [Trametes sanguinea]
MVERAHSRNRVPNAASALHTANIEAPHPTSSGRPQRPALSLLPYVQLNGRKPDSERHVETQTRPCAADAALWVCCGVPLIDVREEHEVPGQVLVAEPLLYEGVCFEDRIP